MQNPPQQGSGWSPPTGPYPPGTGAPGGAPPMYPSMMMPPMMMPPPPPPPRRTFGGFVRTVFTTLAGAILLGSLLLNFYLIVIVAATAGSAGVASKVLQEGDAKQLVAVLPVNGLIMDDSVEAFSTLLRQVENDANLKALIIEVDTPGGAVTASDEIYHLLQKFRAHHANVPVIISMRALATSGGYYVACAGQHVIAQPSTITGNIGVMMPRWNFTKLADKWGIDDTSLASTGSPFKTAGSLIEEETPAERAYWQGIIDEAYGQFRDKVVQARKLKAPVEQVTDGRAFTASQALQMGLVDQIGYLNDAVAYAQNAVPGLSNPHVVKYDKAEGLAALLNAAYRGSNSTSAQAPNANVQVDTKLLHELSTPRVMYLWRGQ